MISGEGGGTGHISWLASGQPRTCPSADPGRGVCCAASLQGLPPVQTAVRLLRGTFWQVPVAQLMQN